MSETVRYDLPLHTWRALHSGLVDWLMRAPLEVQTAVLNRLGDNMDFRRFVTAVNRERVLNVNTLIDDNNQVLIGVSVPVSDGADWVLFQLDPRSHGAELDWLLAAGAYRLDEQIESLIGGA